MAKRSASAAAPPSPANTPPTPTPASAVGTLNEGPLHAALKQFCAQPGDVFEAPVDGYVVDILRGDLIIEVQTAGFAAIAKKLRDLVQRHRLRLVHPVARERWIVKLAEDGTSHASRRKSPKRMGPEGVFEELVSFPELLAHENFELEIVVTREEELRRFDPKRGWRRGHWVVVERRLLEVVDRRLLQHPADLLELVPAGLPERFKTSDLAKVFRRPRGFAQKAAYCLKHCGLIAPAGKDGNAIIYTRA